VRNKTNGRGWPTLALLGSVVLLGTVCALPIAVASGALQAQRANQATGSDTGGGNSQNAGDEQGSARQSQQVNSSGESNKDADDDSSKAGAADNESTAGAGDADDDNKAGRGDDDVSGAPDNDQDDTVQIGPPSPTGSPVPTSGPAGAGRPAARAGGVLGTAASIAAPACKSKRVFMIHIRQRRSRRLVSAVLSVNRAVYAVLTGKQLSSPVHLEGLPAGTFTVSIRAVSTKGKVVRGRRTYRTCVPRSGRQTIPVL
jgi:hypothetical protein